MHIYAVAMRIYAVAMRIYAVAMRIYAWAHYHAVVISPTFNPFYPDVTHVRKDTRPSPAFPWVGVGNKAMCVS